FFFSSRRRHTRFSRDWSSDVCSSDLNGVYGPGHNYFVKSKDGTQDWIVYHGNNNPGEGCGARPSRMQEVNWNADATPDFGIPTNGPLAVPSGEYRIEAEHGTLRKVKLNNVKNSTNQTVSL